MSLINPVHLKKELFPRDYHHLPIFLSLMAIIAGLAAITLTIAFNQNTSTNSNASVKTCIPLAPCVKNHTCPLPKNPANGYFTWCPFPAPKLKMAFTPCDDVWPGGKIRNVGYCKPGTICNKKPRPGAPFGICIKK